jgi:uncharacterized membrane protein YhaH (DUF805 family)
MRQLAALFHPEGRIGPGRYLATGLIAFAIKYTVDQFAAGLLVHRPWMPWPYLTPVTTTLALLSADAVERRFLVVMSLVAAPFIWLGITVTMQRLRSAGLPLWLVLLFFVPVINLGFFLILSAMPERQRATATRGGRDTEDPPWLLDAAVAIAISVLVCLPCAFLSTKVLGRYGFGLFVALPFSLGLVSTVVFTWRARRSYGECLAVAICSIVAAGVAMLAIAVEGLLCLAMAAPIALGLAALGAMVGYYGQQAAPSRRQGVALLLVLALFPPTVMGSESVAARAAEEFEVRTAVEVNAPPERVWRHVVFFAELPDPPEWIFRAGIAYPMRAEIRGRGVGAVRHCVFSTGPFVEPITVWDEPRRLEFAVTHNPPPMQEWSPYRDLQVWHLRGFLVSHRGRFLLTPLDGGRRTLLEGTTWYSHGLWPAGYWRAWSDLLIHRIHLRVLRHVRGLAEAGGSVAIR